MNPSHHSKKTPSDSANECKNLLEKAFDHSLQANIITTIKDGSIIKVNRAACRLFGYSEKELLTKKRADIFLISEANYKLMIRERNTEGKVRADLGIIRKSGRVWPCEITSVIFRDDGGIRNSITSIVDRRGSLLRQKRIDNENNKAASVTAKIAELKLNLSEAKNLDWIRAIGKTTYDVTWDWDIVNNLISFGKSYEKVIGSKLPQNKIDFNEWIALFSKEEGNLLKKKMVKILKAGKNNWEDDYQFTCPDGGPGNIIIRANIVRDNTGEVSRVIGVMHDIGEVLKLEKLLEDEQKIKERQISEAIVEGKEIERSDIGKELHDNINQLLGASMLYLDMAREDVKNGEIYLIHSSEYTHSAIEEIRKLSKGLMADSVKESGLCEAIRRVSQDTMEIRPIQINAKLDDSLEKIMNEKFQLNIFRIFQEQLNNILKHAKASEINISLSLTNNKLVLNISDNGIGFDKTKHVKGIGIKNIISRVQLYNGTVNIISESGKGCQLKIEIPLPAPREK